MLYLRYRPQSWDQVAGNAKAVQALQAQAARTPDKRSHAFAITGPSGCGKTTLARIFARALGATRMDYTELNAAKSRGIDDIREISNRLNIQPHGKARVILIDEAHGLTKDAQTALLKVLEDTPQHVYFILASTDFAKMIATVRNRCTEVPVKPLTPPEMDKLVKQVAAAEGFTVGEDAIDAIVAKADGCSRAALVLLDRICEIEDEAEQAAAVEQDANQTAAFALAQALMRNTPWGEYARMLKECQELTNDTAEGLRHLMLSYATTCLLGGASPRAAAVLEHFGRNFFDSRRAGFILAAYKVLAGVVK